MMSENKGLKQMSPGAIAVIALSVIVLTGIAVIFGFSKVLRLSTTAESAGVTLPANGSTGVYGTSGQFPFLQSLVNCSLANGSGLLTEANYTTAEGTSDGGLITLEPGATDLFSGGAVNCTATTYLADTSAQGTADTFAAGLAIFATFMGVIVLALVGMIIVQMFKNK